MISKYQLAAVLPMLALALGAPNPAIATDGGSLVPRQATGTYFGVGADSDVTINGVNKMYTPGVSQSFDLGSGPLDNVEVIVGELGGVTIGTCTLSGTPTGPALFISGDGGCYARASADGTQSSNGVTMTCDPVPSGAPCA